jgi:hypothetical protein
MRRPLVQRQLALAGVAILGVAGSLAVAKGDRASPGTTLPLADGSYTALAGSSGAKAFGTRTSCGVELGPTTEGVASPVLPCGMRIYVGYGGETALVSVLDNGSVPAGRQFQLTDALARRLGLVGVHRIRWSYAGTG